MNFELDVVAGYNVGLSRLGRSLVYSVWEEGNKGLSGDKKGGLWQTQ